MMTPGTEEFKAGLSGLRERIAGLKRRGTHGGMIDYWGCVTVTDGLIGILLEAGAYAERGECIYAYSVAALVLMNLARLAMTADDSAGGITDALEYLRDLMEKVCAKVEYGSSDADFILRQAIKDSRNKAFDGWDSYVFYLLRPAARFAEAKTAGILDDRLKEYISKMSGSSYRYYMEDIALVRLAAVTAMEGDAEVDQFIDEHIRYDGIRSVAVDRAIDRGDYIRAEMLCMERAKNGNIYQWTKKWYDRLYALYEKTGDRGKQLDLAEYLLLKERDTEYYGKLKQLLTDADRWDAEYPALFDRLEESLDTESCLAILAKEKETDRMIEILEEDPECVFEHCTLLAADFPYETFALCQSVIREDAQAAGPRSHYRRLCGRIRKLHKIGGHAESARLIAELRVAYPRRTALLEELDLVEGKILREKAKRRKK